MDSQGSLDGEIVVETLYEAIMQNNYQYVHRLLERGIDAQPDLEGLTHAFDVMGWDVPMIRLIGLCMGHRTISMSDERRKRDNEL